MHSSVRVLVALRQSNYLPFSQLRHFFYLLLNDRVLMHRFIARARARLRACWWLSVRAGVMVALRACRRSSARVRAWLCARASAALRERLLGSVRAPAQLCARAGT